MNTNDNKNTKKSNAPTTIYSTDNQRKKDINKSCINARTKIYKPNIKSLNND